MSEEMIVGLGQVRYILRSVANGDDQSEVATKAAQIVESAIELLSAYNPNERLNAMGQVNAAWLQWKAGEWTAEEAMDALFDSIVCPPVALSPLPQGED